MRYGSQADQVDEPYPGDFDGDGKADFTLQRRADISVVSSNTPGMFYILTSSGQLRFEYFGLASDRIVPGDYDGDGKYDVAQYRPSNGYWFPIASSGVNIWPTQWGASTDLPVPAMYLP